MPDLDGSWFGRSVILLVRHDETGSFGLVINRPVEDLGSQDVLDLLGISEPLVIPGLLLGGPVSPEQALVLHRLPDLGPDNERVIDGLFIASQRDTLESLCSSSEVGYWIIMGYAGWGAGQLEEEIEMGSWFVVPCADKAERILSAPRQNLWRDLAESIGFDQDSIVRSDTKAMVH
jgi:putative transcriptional regulator